MLGVSFLTIFNIYKCFFLNQISSLKTFSFIYHYAPETKSGSPKCKRVLGRAQYHLKKEQGIIIIIMLSLNLLETLTKKTAVCGSL